MGVVCPFNVRRLIIVGSFCAVSPTEELSPDAFRDFNSQPSYIHEETEFNTMPFRPPFDCSIQQLLSPVPFSASLPLVSSPTDQLLLAQPLFPSPPVADVKHEDEDNSIGELVREMIPDHTPILPIAKVEPQFVDQQLGLNFGSVPPPVSPVMSPLLESNPEFRHLYQHFICNTCRVLVPSDDQQNPFRTILAQMALHPSAQHLLAALLASSAAHLAGVRRESPSKLLISNLLQTTLGGLRKALSDPNEALKDTTLATAIALSSYNIIASDVSYWRVHLDGARDIILHHRRNSSRPLHESSIRAFLCKWFAYLDVIAGASGLTLKEHNYESAVSLIEDVTDNNRHTSASTYEPSKIDMFTGLPSKLLPLLLRIGKLAHQKRVAEHQLIDLSQDLEFQKHVQDLERDLSSAEFDVILLPTIGPELETQLHGCNEAFLSAARLHIQRRLQNMSSEQVRPTVERVFKAIEKVPVGSGPEISLLYPLFSAGVEATGPLRNYAQSRMTEMERFGIGNVRRAKKVMLATWERSDLNGSVRWEDVMDDMGWDLSLA